MVVLPVIVRVKPQAIGKTQSMYGFAVTGTHGATVLFLKILHFVWLHFWQCMLWIYPEWNSQVVHPSVVWQPHRHQLVENARCAQQRIRPARECCSCNPPCHLHSSIKRHAPQSIPCVNLDCGWAMQYSRKYNNEYTWNSLFTQLSVDVLFISLIIQAFTIQFVFVYSHTPTDNCCFADWMFSL